MIIKNVNFRAINICASYQFHKMFIYTENVIAPPRNIQNNSLDYKKYPKTPNYLQKFDDL